MKVKATIQTIQYEDKIVEVDDSIFAILDIPIEEYREDFPTAKDYAKAIEEIEKVTGISVDDGCSMGSFITYVESVETGNPLLEF